MKGRQRILIVDDKASFRFMLSGYLEDAGYEVVMADGGEEALRILAQGACDLVMTDIVMPEMDGITLNCIRRAWRRSPYPAYRGPVSDAGR